MNSFDEHGKGHETQFSLDAANEFKAEAKRNKALGYWAAELIGKSDAETERYAQDLIVEDLMEAGAEDVFRKLRSDLTAAGSDISDDVIRAKMAEELAKARIEVQKGD